MDLTTLVHGVTGPWIYVVVALLACAESAAFVGLVVPGETVMVIGGVVAAAGQADLGDR
jgi:membrane protein DedA with SNARE-associated domain